MFAVIFRRLYVSLSAFCDNENIEKESPCEKYNHLFERLQLAERKSRCNEEQGCVFVGRTLTGNCISDSSYQSNYPQKLPNNLVLGKGEVGRRSDSNEILVESTKINSKHNHSPSQDIKDSISLSDEVLVEIEGLLKGRITSSAVESLKDSQQLINEIAKKLVLEIFEDRNNIDQLALLLHTLFSYEPVLSPTRSLIYWSLQQQSTFHNTLWLLRRQRNYFFHGSGKSYMHHQLVLLLQNWLEFPGNRTLVIGPLLTSSIHTLIHKKGLQGISELAAQSIDTRQNQTLTAGAIKWGIREYLKSDHAKYIVRENMMQVLKRAGQSEVTNSTHVVAEALSPLPPSKP